MKIIKESYKNIFDDKEEKQKYLDEVWNILLKSYDKIGGPHSDPDEIMQDNVMWKLDIRQGKVTAVSLYKMEGGTRKLFLCGTDGTDLGKNNLYTILRQDVKLDRAYAEVSGAIEHILVNKFGVKPVPSYVAEKILNDKGKSIEKDSDGYHYIRRIGGEPLKKIMVSYNAIPEKYKNLVDK